MTFLIPSPAPRERGGPTPQAWEGEGLLITEGVIGRARHLRQDVTEAERRLWSALRDRRLNGYRFRRQYPIGNYIVDFACTKHRLVVHQFEISDFLATLG